MNWTELNALLKVEMSATWNCKRVMANCGLRFPMKNLMLKVSNRLFSALLFAFLLFLLYLMKHCNAKSVAFVAVVQLAFTKGACRLQNRYLLWGNEPVALVMTIVHVLHCCRPMLGNPDSVIWKLCLWNPESSTLIFLLCNLESWTLESGIPLKESKIPLTIKIQNPSSADKESGIYGVESRIQNCLAFPP